VVHPVKKRQIIHPDYIYTQWMNKMNEWMNDWLIDETAKSQKLKQNMWKW
jgi:hypothetical protein